MTLTLGCSIPRPTVSYPIEIGRNIWLSQIPFLKTLANRFAIISDSHVGVLYGKALTQKLSKCGLESDLFCFPAGEMSKSRAVKEELEDQLFKKKWGRDTCIIALGGGVVTDLAGYVASTFCRGVPLVMAPTSLLGMVDASLGGKTGVNVPQGKNLLGCIYQPQKVIMDLATLVTLPRREFANGAVEMIKHGAIADEMHFSYLESHADSLLLTNSVELEKAIYDSSRIKKEIIEQGELGTSRRDILNFGHTIGHALELVSDYALSHGEAVAIGMLVESYLAVTLGILSKKALKRLRDILLLYGLPLKIPCSVGVEEMCNAMIMDKKSIRGQPHFILISAIGGPTKCLQVDHALIQKGLQWALSEFR